MDTNGLRRCACNEEIESHLPDWSYSGGDDADWMDEHRLIAALCLQVVEPWRHGGHGDGFTAFILSCSLITRSAQMDCALRLQFVGRR